MNHELKCPLCRSMLDGSDNVKVCPKHYIELLKSIELTIKPLENGKGNL